MPESLPRIHADVPRDIAHAFRFFYSHPATKNYICGSLAILEEWPSTKHACEPIVRRAFSKSCELLATTTHERKHP